MGYYVLILPHPLFCYMCVYVLKCILSILFTNTFNKKFNKITVRRATLYCRSSLPRRNNGS